MEHQGGTSSLRGFTVPSSQGWEASRDLVLGFWGNEKEITALRARRTHREEDTEGGLAGGGQQLEARWGGGNSLWVVKEWHFLGSGVPVKQLRSRRKGMGVERERESERARGIGWGRPGEQGQCREHTWSESQHQNVRKNTAHKESPWEKSHIQEQSLMAGSNHQAGQRKMAQHRLWARRGFYRRGRLRKLAHER
jgi:hypothetical protein